jgi:hypothetical protein
MTNILHCLYVGLCDKDTKKQEIDIDSAKVAIALNADRVGIKGYTLIEAEGFYTHEDGTQVYEPTLVVQMLFTSAPIIYLLAEGLKTDLNQKSIGYQAIKLDKCELL